MGAYFHKPYTPFQQMFNGKDLRAIVLGLDCAGKTTLLYKLNIGEIVSTIPQIGLNVDTVEFQEVRLVAWDLCEY
jgi:GTPase SAR1 family protein